jgi:hypothetical protein
VTANLAWRRILGVALAISAASAVVLPGFFVFVVVFFIFK